jgi:phenylacetate-CoA ligase
VTPSFPDRPTLVARQLAQLRGLLRAIVPANPFYTRKLASINLEAAANSIAAFTRSVPFTTKLEIAHDQQVHPTFGSNLTFPLDRYTRFHQTSGTTGLPIRWLDTPESWNGLLHAWIEVLHAANVQPADRVLFAFTFGPFIGFWMAFEAASRLGCLCLPAGGLTSTARLRMILDNRVSVLCCTPTYAARLAEVAAQEQINLSQSAVRIIIVAGEPGGSIPAVRARLQNLWPGARVFDHHGMTEVGPVTFECPAQPGILHVIESAFLPEIIDPVTTLPAVTGQSGELILTTLTRTASPLLRYRTGDLVKELSSSGSPPYCPCGRSELALDGGILGRTDDMLIVRGVNLYPGAVEAVIRRYSQIVEFQVEITAAHHLDELLVRIELIPDRPDPGDVVRQLQRAFHDEFALRIPVQVVPTGTLPRFEMKAQRWIRPATPPPGTPINNRA